MSSNPIFNYTHWEGKSSDFKKQFLSAQPFPHLVVDNFLMPEAAEQLLSEFPDPASDQWVHYSHVNERKLAQSKWNLMPPSAQRVISELNGEHFVQFVTEITGIPGLLPDSMLEGGGLHQTKKGGFLNVHKDFTSHPFNPTWARRINIIIYLNKDWKDEYGGHLELWDLNKKSCCRRVLPVFNRALIFATDCESFHGHPDPLTCPPGWTRKSLALYYFTDEKKRPFTKSTEYRGRTQDRATKKALIFMDKMALRAYDFLKRRLGIDNAVVGRVLRRLFK